MFGTDGGVLPHGDNAREASVLMDAGLPPLEVLRAATVNASRAFRLEGVAGTIAPGLSADIIAVDGDSLVDRAALSRVAFVMSRGAVVRHGKQPPGEARP